jgi:hypothetical protein
MDGITRLQRSPSETFHEFNRSVMKTAKNIVPLLQASFFNILANPKASFLYCCFSHFEDLMLSDKGKVSRSQFCDLILKVRALTVCGRFLDGE